MIASTPLAAQSPTVDTGVTRTRYEPLRLAMGGTSPRILLVGGARTVRLRYRKASPKHAPSRPIITPPRMMAFPKVKPIAQGSTVFTEFRLARSWKSAIFVQPRVSFVTASCFHRVTIVYRSCFLSLRAIDILIACP